jgi:hypothetical protein
VSLLIDGLILLFAGLGVYAEAKRGLFLALTDIIRVAIGLALGFAAFSLLHRISGSYAFGFVGFGVGALIGIFGVRVLLHLLRLDPAWGRSPAGKVGGGVLGLALGCLISAVFVPVIGRDGWGREAVPHSILARPFLETMPTLYYAADAFNLDMPMLNARAIRFEDEGKAEQAALVERINYTKLDGSTCIECGAAVKFEGYKRRIGVTVSPEFICPNCGRTSDGCQTFEGFHRMYGHCPVEVSEALGPIDCGVWPNDRPVYPQGECPLDGNFVR